MTRLVHILRRRAEDGSIELVARLYIAAPDDALTIEPQPGFPGFASSLDMDFGPDRSDTSAFLDAVLERYHGSRYWAEEMPTEPLPQAT